MMYQHEPVNVEIITGTSFTCILLFLVQKIQEEVDSWKKKVGNLNHMADKLCDEYTNDDTSKIKTQKEDLNNKWAHVLSR